MLVSMLKMSESSEFSFIITYSNRYICVYINIIIYSMYKVNICVYVIYFSNDIYIYMFVKYYYIIYFLVSFFS